MSPDEVCANCGERVAGRFCGNCGQRLANPVHSLSHFIAEATEDLTHADSRLWRTLLALLFKPGFLTREFLNGHRARYLPPLRLYLVLSVVFFLTLATWGPPLYLVGVQDRGDGTRKLIAAPMMRTPGKVKATAPELGPLRNCSTVEYHGPWETTLQAALRKTCQRTLEDNGKSLQEAFFHAIPRALFVFLPLLALVMMALYWRPRRFYVEHLLLFIHNHAFIFLAFTLFWLVQLPLPEGWPSVVSTLALLAYCAWYVYKSMRVVYGQSRRRTLAKLAVISFSYVVSAVVMLGVTTIYSVIAL